MREGATERDGPSPLGLLLPLFAAGLRSGDAPCAAAAAASLAALGRALGNTPLLPATYEWFCSPYGVLPLVLHSLQHAGNGGRGGGAPQRDRGAAGAPLAADAEDGEEGASPREGENGDTNDGPLFAFSPPPAPLPAPLSSLLLERFCARSLRDFFGVRLKRLAPSPADWLRLLLAVLPAAAERPALRKALSRDGAAAALASDCCACAAANSPPQLRLSALAALEALWSVCPEGVEADASASRAALSCFRAAARDGGEAVQVPALESLFRLLHAFIGCGSGFAPLVYKALIFSLIENHGTDPVRDAALDLMADALGRHPDIPVGVLAEPLAKRAQQLGFCDRDFFLLARVAEHARLEPRHAALLLDALSGPALQPSGPHALPAQRVVVLLAPRLFERGGACCGGCGLLHQFSLSAADLSSEANAPGRSAVIITCSRPVRLRFHLRRSRPRPGLAEAACGARPGALQPIDDGRRCAPRPSRRIANMRAPYTVMRNLCTSFCRALQLSSSPLVSDFPRFPAADEGASAEGSLARALCFSFLLSLSQCAHPAAALFAICPSARPAACSRLSAIHPRLERSMT